MSLKRRTSNQFSSRHCGRIVTLIAAIMLFAASCGVDASSLNASASNSGSTGASTTDSGNSGGSEALAATGDSGRQGSATFTRGTATLPADHCPGDGQLLGNVVHLDDLAAAGFPVTDDYSVGRANTESGKFTVSNYPENGQINCSTDLGNNTRIYFELHRNGRGLAANNDVYSQHTIAGTEFTIYRLSNSGTMWSEATFPNDYSTVGATSLVFGYSELNEDKDLSEDEIARGLLAIAELMLPRVAYDPPAPLVEEVAPAGPAVPDWWFGCDLDNFVLQGRNSDTVFAALGEGPAESVKLDDNPLGALITDCRAYNGITRVSIVAVPPIGGLIESVDDILGYRTDAQDRTVAGIRAAVYSEPDDLWPSGTVHLNVDGFSIIIKASDYDSRRLTGDQLNQLAITAAETFLAQR